MMESISIEISKAGGKRLKGLAERNNVPLSQIEEEFINEVKRLNEEGAKDNLERLGILCVMNNYRKAKSFQTMQTQRGRTKPEIIYGFLTGDRGMWDTAEQIRKTAKRYVDNNGRQAAIDAQLINGDNQVLDTRAQVFGRENDDYLQPLDPALKIRSRTMYGCFRRNGDTKYRFGSIQTNDNALAWAWRQVPMYTPLQVPGIVKEESATDLRINSSKGEDTTSIFKGVDEDLDINKIILDTIGKQYTALDRVEDHYEAFKDAWDRRIFLRGVVSWINIDRPTSWGAIYIGLMDPDNEDVQVRLLVPEHVPIDFGELSEVITVPGKTKRSRYMDQETQKWEDGDVIVDAFGLYALPEFRTPKDVGLPETLEDEEELEGWIP